MAGIKGKETVAVPKHGREYPAPSVGSDHLMCSPAAVHRYSFEHSPSFLLTGVGVAADFHQRDPWQDLLGLKH